ncbi:zinc finger Y-chromosomal protein 1-like isoform X4 [Colletes gigas]|uniref:zinc finger Y-chromosomal protein 1-like isoform X4 n=1 Tax=Colletes gigas TaxID=935657 RepID=UPI001C9AAFE5|nr:zinc finger Y-chromosomal protein 1-like isoform X4 [Colletes gigas]
MSSLDYLDLCRLCLVKDRVSVPIFDGEGDVRQIFLKIAACLPVKVAREDKLPKKICDDCVYKVELFYQFWNTTVNAEKQLLQWLGEVGMEGKQGYVTNVLNPNVMKQEQSTENRLDGSVMQQVSEHQNNMGIGMMDNIGLGIPMIISNTNQQQQITSVPMDTSSNSAQNVQAVPGPSSQTTHNQISQNQTSSTQQEEEEESSEDEENSDDECDGDEGLPVKEESEEDPNSRTIEPTTFVNVSLACDEAGPSGLQQQKIADMPEIPMPQTADGDPKSGVPKIADKPAIQNPAQPHFVVCPGVPILDQDTSDQFPVEVKAPPISDDEEDRNVRSDVESNCDDVSSEKTLEDDDDSDMNDDLYLGGVNYCSLPHSAAKRVNNDIVPNGVTNDCTPQIVKEDLVNTEKAVLVPVRDPVTREIKNMLVPVEVMDDTGFNIIKTVLIPIQDEDGTMAYEVKKVTVPLKPEMWTVPQMKTEPLSTSTPAQANEKTVEAKQPREKEAKIEIKKKNCEKPEEVSPEQDPGAEPEPDTPKEEVDLILEKLRNVCPFCQKSFIDAKEMDRHVFRNHKKPYRCKQCYLVYFRKESFEDHMKTHSVDYLECPFCRMRYKSMCGLRNHQIRVHSTIEAKFVCDHCDKRYRLKSDLAVHIDRIHMNVTHVCRFCGKSVKNVMEHEYQHQKANKKVDCQFRCHLCPKKFQVRNSLDNHLLMHKRGFKCNHCKEVFNRPSALKVHKEVVHGPSMVCTICDKKFNNRTSFHKHVVVTHGGIRPYKCDICGDDFTQRHCLIKHRNTHPGPLPPISNKTRIADIAKQILQKP